MCSKNESHTKDGNSDKCLLRSLTSGVWLNETLIIVHETSKSFKEISLKWGEILK